MASIDIFRSDAFSMFNLTKFVSEMPYVPGAVGKLGLFADSMGVTTTTIAVENEKGTLTLIPSSERGGPGVKNKRDSRTLRNFNVQHKKVSDTIKADEITNVRGFGTDSEVMAVEQMVQRRQSRMLKSTDATVEYMRLGALKGVIYDADGTSVIYNLFTEFGIAQPTQDFTLGTGATEQLTNCMTLRETIQEALGIAGDDSLEVGVLCGATWFKRFISHPTIKDAYKFYQSVQQASNPLQKDLRYKGFKFGDVTFWVYRGNVGGVPFVAANEAHAFPMDVPDVFIERYGPADYLETVNTEGLPRYSKQAIDPMFGRYVELEVQTNPIALCTRPNTLVKLTTSN